MSDTVEASTFEAQLRSARMRRLEIEGGAVTLQYELPGAFRVQQIVDAMRENDGERLSDLLAPLGRGWTGVTQVTLAGEGVGGQGDAPFGIGVLRIALADRPQWVIDWAMHAVQEAAVNAKRLKDLQGN